MWSIIVYITTDGKFNGVLQCNVVINGLFFDVGAYLWNRSLGSVRPEEIFSGSLHDFSQSGTHPATRKFVELFLKEEPVGCGGPFETT